MYYGSDILHVSMNFIMLPKNKTKINKRRRRRKKDVEVMKTKCVNDVHYFSKETKKKNYMSGSIDIHYEQIMC